MVPAEFYTELANFLKARFPFLYIASWEEARVSEAIEKVAADAALIRTARRVFNWSVTAGMTSNGEPVKCPLGNSPTASALEALDFIAKCDEPAIFVLQDFHVYFGGQQGRPGDVQVIRKIRDLVIQIKQSPKPKNVIFLCPTVVLPTELQKDVSIIDYNLPTQDEIETLLDEMIEANSKSGRITIDVDAEGRSRLAKAALGLTLQEAENAFALAMVKDGCLNVCDIDIVLQEKCQVIKKSEILELVKANIKIDDVGGLENLKRWLRKRNKSWLDSAQKYGLPAPKGVLLTGVPGCGKSLIAKAISAMWQLPLLRLDMGKIFSGIVGSSEENIRRAIKTAEAIAPSVLWIDEIEKGFTGIGSSGDSGTSTRIFGTFLTWMQEKTQPVFVVATANNIQSLPPELMRKGRFDEIFFVDLPTLTERKDIFRLHVEKRLKDPEVAGSLEVSDKLHENLASMTEGFVGAEIEHVVISALFEAFSESRAVCKDDFERSIKNTVPLSVTQAEQILALREWANVRAVAATPREDLMTYNTSAPKKDKAAPDGENVGSWRGGRAVDV